VRGADSEALRQRGHLFAPGMRRLGEAVKQEDERALSFHHAVETDAVDPDATLHAAMPACPMPLAQACLLTSPSASGCSPGGSPLSSGTPGPTRTANAARSASAPVSRTTGRSSRTPPAVGRLTRPNSARRR